MKVYKGKSVYKGMAMGKVFVLKGQDLPVKRCKTDDVKAEISRLHEAQEEAKARLQNLYKKAVREVGETSAAIFEVYQIMLEDEEYLEAIENRIREEQVNAEYAVAMAGDSFSNRFENMENEYIKARAADVRDVSSRLVKILRGSEETENFLTEPSIIVADDLSPSEIVMLDREKILAFVTVQGSMHSHMAILARTMNIPALVGVPFHLQEIQTGMEAVADGFRGEVIFEPTQDRIVQIKKKIAEEKEKQQQFWALKGKETVSRSGGKIRVFANIANVEDVDYAVENDAEGIGLFRSEFLYLGRESAPKEEEQFRAYKQVLQKMAGKKVIIRTLDIGADKKADYLHLEEEKNPALGYRAIRICLKEPEIFKTQLRALLRAAVYGNLSVLYPMITSKEEVERIQTMVKEVQRELEREQIPCQIPEQGIMIETPAAALISDELAELVDFFSIGTNDLTQYTLALDRQNAKLDEFFQPHHKAVLKMIKMVAANAHQAGKWVGICGELGADLELTETFLKMGIDELSVIPSMVLKVRKQVREIL